MSDAAGPGAVRPDRIVRARTASARLLPLALGLLLVAGLARPAPPTAPPVGAGGIRSDADLYRAIDRRVAAGQGYYAAVATEHRRGAFPLRPFVTVRLPTRAWLFRAVGADGALWLLRLLTVAVVVGTALRLRAATLPLPLWGTAVMLVALSTIELVFPTVALWSDAWAGWLAALALACRTDRRWGASVALGLSAVLFRELASPLLVVMAFAAWAERRRAEAFAWMAALATAAAALGAHALAVHAVLRPGDLASQGWVRIGGWAFDLAMAHDTTPLVLLPAAAAAVAAPIALFGWVAHPGGYARRVALTLLAWLLAFLVVGRPENSYWGLLLAPLWLAGLPLAAGTLARSRRSTGYKVS